MVDLESVCCLSHILFVGLVQGPLTRGVIETFCVCTTQQIKLMRRNAVMAWMTCIWCWDALSMTCRHAVLSVWAHVAVAAWGINNKCGANEPASAHHD